VLYTRPSSMSLSRASLLAGQFESTIIDVAAPYFLSIAVCADGPGYDSNMYPFITLWLSRDESDDRLLKGWQMRIFIFDSSRVRWYQVRGSSSRNGGGGRTLTVTGRLSS
jgi:hypothetical protein